MKKILLLLPLFFTTMIHAQEFKEGTNVISAGLGLGSTYGNVSHSSESPTINLQYERGIWPVDGPGIISLGGYLGFKSYKYHANIGAFHYEQKWKYTVVGVRSAYHYTGPTVDKLDLYGGVMLAYYALSYSYTDNDQFNNYDGGGYDDTVRFSMFFGGRYYFAKDIAAFAELGWGISVLNIGAAYRF